MLVEESKGWGRIWKIQIPQKIKIFLWRVCRNNVHVRSLIKEKGVNIATLCPFCDLKEENLRHLCLECNYAKGCWNELGLEFHVSQTHSVSAWLLQVLANESFDKLAQIATVLWGIWSARNLKVWQNKVLIVQMAMQWSVIQVKQWRDSQQLKFVATEVCEEWSYPKS